MTLDEASVAFGNAAHRSMPATRSAAARLTQECLGAVLAEWPVLTGRSQAGWSASRTLTGGDLVNRADYASEVHDGLADTLVISCFDQFEGQTVRAIERVLTRSLEGR